MEGDMMVASQKDQTVAMYSSLSRDNAKIFDLPRIVRELGSVTEEQVRRLELLEKYDLSCITKLFADGHKPLLDISEQVFMVKMYFGSVDETLAKNLEVTFKRWMAMTILLPDLDFSPPTRAVDMYWHLFILHTREYRQFCEQIFGRFIGHSPLNTETAEQVRAAGVETKNLYPRLFDTPSHNAFLRIEKPECSSGSSGDGNDCSKGNG